MFLLLLCFLPISFGFPVLPVNDSTPMPEKTGYAETFESYLHILIEPFVKEALHFARAESDMIFMNIAIRYNYSIEQRVYPRWDGEYLMVKFSTNDGELMRLCEARGTAGLKLLNFIARNHTIIPHVYCYLKKDPLPPPPPEELNYHGISHVGAFFIIVMLILAIIGMVFYNKRTVVNLRSQLLKFTKDTFSLISFESAA